MQSAGIYFFRPPYEELTPVTPESTPRGIVPGAAVVWAMSADSLPAQRGWIAQRPRGPALVIVLPPPAEIPAIADDLPRLAALLPHAVLPSGNLTLPTLLQGALSTVPRDLPLRTATYLEKYRIVTDQTIRSEIRRIFELAPRTQSIAKLCREMGTSRRTLGRHFEACGLPVPSHWLQFARLSNIVLRAHGGRTAMFRLATAAGYPDGFTMSNQLKRLIGLRPTEVRGFYGFEWLLETWLAAENERNRKQR